MKNKHFHIRGSKSKKREIIKNLMLNPLWEDAHRYTTTDRIIDGVIGRIGDTEYHEE